MVSETENQSVVVDGLGPVGQLCVIAVPLGAAPHCQSGFSRCSHLGDIWVVRVCKACEAGEAVPFAGDIEEVHGDTIGLADDAGTEAVELGH
jgi:hypothetical protein